jgi:protein TonB
MLATDERRLLALLAFSVLLHAGLLAWVKAPLRPVAAKLSALTASLRFAAPEASEHRAGERELLASPSRPQARQLPARREPQRLPTVLGTAGPTDEPAAASPTGAVSEPAPLAAGPSSASSASSASSTSSATPRFAADAAAHALAGYGLRLSELFSRQQQYPPLAARRGWDGEVRLRLSLASQGHLSAVRLERSSGFEVLDRHALAMIGQIGQLPPPPAELAGGEIEVIVPVHYRLRKAS